MESMFSRFKTKVLNAVSMDITALPVASAPPTNTHLVSPSTPTSSPMSLLGPPVHRIIDNRALPNKFTYNRPTFLQLMTQDELKASSDHNVRPIIVPRDIGVMPWHAGYAECVNSGKSEFNEDQCSFYRQCLKHPTNKDEPGLPYTYFGIFDGHAGFGAALAASHQFHYILHEKLVDVIDLLVSSNAQRPKVTLENIPNPWALTQRNVSKDELIIGALESAFLEMDALLAGDRTKYRNAGGCTALVSLFIDGKMFVANAGDSRGILCQRLPVADEEPSNVSSPLSTSTSSAASSNDGNALTTNSDAPTTSTAVKTPAEKPMTVSATLYSYDHTPETERIRLLSTAQLNPSLMAGEYVATEYAKRPLQRDLGKRVLYRHGAMKGWSYKTLTIDDLKTPIVTGEGKRSRLLGTIGVTRGFGDHDLRALCTGLAIKPFLSPHPDVICRDLTKVESSPNDHNEDGEYGILIMATDGLWDVLDIDTVSQVVFATLAKYPVEKHRYTMVAQELVAKSRGRVNESGHWRLAESKAAATVDDISVLVIPVYQYYKEYIEWRVNCLNQSTRTMPTEYSGDSVQEPISSNPVTAAFRSISLGSQTTDQAEEAKIDSLNDLNVSQSAVSNVTAHTNGMNSSVNGQ